MKMLVKKVRDFLHQTAGPTAVEYAVLLVLMIFGAMTAVSLLGANLSNTIVSTAQALPLGAGEEDSSESSQNEKKEDKKSGKDRGGKDRGGRGRGGRGRGVKGR